MTFEDGLIAAVSPAGPADQVGIKPGMHLYEINGQAYSKELFVSCRDGESPYTVKLLMPGETREAPKPVDAPTDEEKNGGADAAMPSPEDSVTNGTVDVASLEDLSHLFVAEDLSRLFISLDHEGTGTLQREALLMRLEELC